MYYELYDMLNTAIFNGSATGYEELLLTLVCGCAVLFLLALPFIIVLKVVRMICG